MLERESDPVGAVRVEPVPERRSGTCLLLSATDLVEKPFNLTGRQLLKARAYWARKTLARQSRENCGRCGQPNRNGYRQCDQCRDYQARYRASRQTKPVTVDGKALDAVLRRLASVEQAVARLQLRERDAYKRGFRTGQRLERKAKLADDLPTITEQELATMNHAYARADS